MPESTARPGANKRERGGEAKGKRDGDSRRSRGGGTPSSPAKATKKSVKGPSNRRWVPPLFISVGLLGVAWLVVYYIAGPEIAPMAAIGNWNILIGMGLMGSAFVLSTLWR